ncbi:60 kDa SS-A/Ro ribonucleoprotein [Lingula anatina]|uniref:60 kDa SS-A/Ro ribonucleoprotein n=1 Tax=Lingula anatina TaxID=7574 RepID=A0A1S3HVE9_LINAN|nr:60 kDa SS-A/Ro ribonucleoprotein [Lingula anatina]|eukprot:XP_013390017.1 60 kDa SS-A/Ro ribonucleoprotein [Lingula anatina]
MSGYGSLASAIGSVFKAPKPAKNDIPQSKPIDKVQTKNSEGGYVYKVDDMNRLRRFLILGSEGGTYYIKEQELGIENATAIMRLIQEDKGQQVVNEIKHISVEGRASKQNAILFALALCARLDNKFSKKAAYEALSDICRIPTHLFTFIDYSEKLAKNLSKGTGWGRAHRRAVAKWYNKHSKNPKKLAMHVTKYRNRSGWAHRDLFRLTHLKPEGDVAAVVKYVVKGLEAAKETYSTEMSEAVRDTLTFLEGVEDAKKATNEEEIIALIQHHGLVREHIPTKLLNSKGVWKALLKSMPMTAMIRNLAKMTDVGILESESEEEQIIISRLQSEEALREARIHPFNVLLALHTYSKGEGEKGKLKWNPNQHIVNALDQAFYKCFKYVEPTNKRVCIGMDVSGSMDHYSVLGSSALSPRLASGALMMTTLHTEPKCDVVAFSDKLVPLNVNLEWKLNETLQLLRGIPFGRTDCALPMLWARENKREYDTFIVYTDCETWIGGVHPAEALRQYREASGIWDAKLIVCAMTSNGFTIADPEDPGMLDMAGFDSAGPEVMRSFMLGEI